MADPQTTAFIADLEALLTRYKVAKAPVMAKLLCATMSMFVGTMVAYMEHPGADDQAVKDPREFD